MLSTSYDALRLFQKKISKAKNLEDIKSIADEMGVNLSLGISPRSIWVAKWDLIEETLSGIMEFNVEVNFNSSLGHQEWHFPFRYEKAQGLSLKEWKEEIFHVVHDAIKNK